MCSAGCGGSGGSDECNDSVACIQPDPESIVDSTALLGSYEINYALTSSSCAGASPLQQLRERYLVTSGVGYHGISTIEVSSDTGPDYQTFSTVGNTDGKTYFNVSEIGDQELLNFISGLRCSESISLSFFDLGQSSASVVRTSDIDCAKSGEPIVQGSSAHCQVVYRGEGSFSPQQ